MARYRNYSAYLLAHVTETPESIRRQGIAIYDPHYGDPIKVDRHTAIHMAITSAIAFLPLLLLL